MKHIINRADIIGGLKSVKLAKKILSTINLELVCLRILSYYIITKNSYEN